MKLFNWAHMALLQVKGKKSYGLKKLKAPVEPMDTEEKPQYEVKEIRTSESPVMEMHTAFGILDRNSDGHVYADDIYDMLQALGHNVDRTNVQDFMKVAANGGHSFEEEQFISWMEKLIGNQSYDDVLILKGAFETFDKDKDGYINKYELEEGLKLIGEDVSARTLDLMMQAADIDHDGLINFKDFTAIMA